MAQEAQSVGLDRQNDFLQFARLVDEINAAGLNRGQIATLQDSMGLNSEEITSLLNHGTEVYDRIKDLLFDPKKARWAVQESRPLDEIWVKDRTTLKTAKPIAIEMPSAIPYEQRLRIAWILALLLNVQH